MAAALCAAEGGGGYIFPKSSRGTYSKFFRPGGYTPYPLPPIPDPWFIPRSFIPEQNVIAVQYYIHYNAIASNIDLNLAIIKSNAIEL